MANCEATALEPFLESAGYSPVGLGGTDFIAGYRCRETGAVVCTIHLPVDLVETIVLASVTASAVITPGGQVESSFEFVRTRSQTTQVLKSAPIDALVARALARDSLLLEGATEVELEQLHDRLERSLRLVTKCLQTFRQIGQ